MRKAAEIIRKVNTEVKPQKVLQAPVIAPSLSNKTLQDCSRLLQTLGAEVATLNIKQLQRFWLAIMADKSASHKDKLQASKLYAESIGAFDANKQKKGINGANIRWKDTIIEAELVQN